MKNFEKIIETELNNFASEMANLNVDCSDRESSTKAIWLSRAQKYTDPKQQNVAGYLYWRVARDTSVGTKYEGLTTLTKSLGFKDIGDMVENIIDFDGVEYYADVVNLRNTTKPTANVASEAAKDSIKRINNTAASKVLTMEKLSSMSTEQLAAKAAQTVEAINTSTKTATEAIKRSGGGGGGGSTGFTTGEVVGIVATLGVLSFCAYKAWDKFYGDGNVNDIELADYGFSSSFVPGANFSNTF